MVDVKSLSQAFSSPEKLKELLSRLEAQKMTHSADDKSARIDAQLDELFRPPSPPQINSEPPSPPGNLGEKSLSNPKSTNPRSITNQDSITSHSSSNEQHIPPSLGSKSGNSFDWPRMGDNTPKSSHGLGSRPRHVTFALPDLENEFSESESTTPDASHSAKVASNSNPDFVENNLPGRRKGSTINLNTSVSPIFESNEIIGSPPAGPSSSRSAPANDHGSERLLPAWQTNAIRPQPNVKTPTGSSSAGSHSQPASHRIFFSNPRSSIHASAPTSTPTSSSTQLPRAPIVSRLPFPVPLPPEPELGAIDADGGDENTRERNQRTVFFVGPSPCPSLTDLFSKIGDFW